MNQKSHKRIVVLTWLLLLGIAQIAGAQTLGGCTDPQATNFNASAIWNNGSCTYNNSSISLMTKGQLPTQLNECSGLIYYNGKLYGHQDSGGPASIFEIDTTTGALLRTINLSGVTNVDWEDITQDSLSIYIGDFGNNASGNRTDLKIYKFPKSDLNMPGATITIPANHIGVINFSYAEQTNFAPQPGNATYWDCEAMAINRGWIHLFSKNWIGNYTIHYLLPCNPGTYVTQRLDSFNTGGVRITGADFGADDELILVGYQNTGIANCALFLAYGFSQNYYYLSSGCSRKLDIATALTYGQVEGICFDNALHGFIANENFTYSIFHVPQQLYRFNIQNLIKPYYLQNQQTFYNVKPLVGTIRFNSTMGILEGYDGSHWVKL